MLEVAGLGKELDDLVADARPGSELTLMEAAENAWINVIGKDCSTECERVIRFIWQQSCSAVQQAVLRVDSSALSTHGAECACCTV